MFQYIKNTELKALGADIVMEEPTNGIIYICTKDTSKINQATGGTRPTDAELRSLNIWQIKRLQETTTANGKETTTTYPNGSSAFAFAVSEVANYNFLLRR